MCASESPDCQNFIQSNISTLKENLVESLSTSSPSAKAVSVYNIALTLKTLTYFCINHGRFFQFEIIINVLVSSFCFI